MKAGGDLILNIIIAIIMIGLIVLIHEFGHFIVAKANGVAVVRVFNRLRT